LLAVYVPRLLQRLRDSADSPALHEEWFSVKAQAKKRAAAKIESLTGIKVNPNALFDVQVGSAAQVITHVPASAPDFASATANSKCLALSKIGVVHAGASRLSQSEIGARYMYEMYGQGTRCVLHCLLRSRKLPIKLQAHAHAGVL
jgi:hypothetical protein